MGRKNNSKEVEAGYSFRSNTAVRVVKTDLSISEYDAWDRLVFHIDHNGYWSMRVFAPVVEGGRVSLEPLQVIHKYWEYYNDLRK